MKKYVMLTLIAMISTAMAFGQNKEYKINVGQFDKLTVFNNVSVVYECDPELSGYAVFEAADKYADAFIFTNQEGNLKVQVETEDTDKTGLPTVHVYSDYLSQVESSSDHLVKLESIGSVPHFTAKLIGNGKIVVDNIKCTDLSANVVTGNGTIVLHGKATNARYKMVGTGLIQADEVEADNVKCSIMGGGSIGCWATTKLDVRGIGSTKIYYKGTPEVKKVGGGKVKSLDAVAENEYPAGE